MHTTDTYAVLAYKAHFSYAKLQALVSVVVRPENQKIIFEIR